ncbi:MAG TPA: hypothetical protein VE732_04785 [Nitrososphaera sp.]|nr:hypothetical protein [Nitrososphaera sp.]
MNESEKVVEQINLKVQKTLSSLKPHLRSWAQQHLTQPRRCILSLDSDGNSLKDFWLVTDHNGKEDSSYRVVYDADEQVFGLEVTLESGIEWYMGAYGTFAEAIENM